jgi:hypothetical protein
MTWSKRGTALLLAAVVFLTAVPAFACLLGASPARHACCRHMTAQCIASAMTGQASCCQARPQNPSTVPAILSATQQTHAAAASVPHAGLAAPAAITTRTPRAAEAPPPRLSPAATTTLRI